MTGSNEGDRVSSIGRANRSGSPSSTDLSGLLGVTDRCAVRNLEKSLPGETLKGRSLEPKREIKCHELAVEVGLELFDGPLKDDQTIISMPGRLNEALGSTSRQSERG